MTHTEEILSDKRVIVVRLTGDYDVKLMDELAIKFRTKALDLKYCLICDITKGHNKITLSDGLKSLKKYEKPEYKKLKGVPVAVVAKGSQYVFFKVIEQFLINANGDFKVFKDLETAVNWFGMRSKK